MLYCINPRRLARAAALLGLLVLAAGAAEARPRVVTSIAPLQSLAAGVMAGIAVPTVLVGGSGSPHGYALRPSEARRLSEADLVFWVGPSYEAFLAKPLAGLAGAARAVALISAPGVRTLPARSGGAWEDASGHGHDHPGSVDDTDPHVFLSPANAQAIVRAMADALGAADPARRAQYEANAAAYVARLVALDAELTAMLLPVRHVPYVVFHDGYQYFERHYGLNAVGAITIHPERAPGARRVRDIRRKVESLGAACVMAEPQFNAAVVRTVAEGTPARTGTLDYLGSGLPPGPDAYFSLMRGLARALADCLGG